MSDSSISGERGKSAEQTIGDPSHKSATLSRWKEKLRMANPEVMKLLLKAKNEAEAIATSVGSVNFADKENPAVGQLRASILTLIDAIEVLAHDVEPEHTNPRGAN
jgi:hypothetical protein